MSNGYSSSSGRRGLTLVEVIAGLVLMATLLTSVLAAFRTHAAQIRAARDRLKASELAEGLLSEWMARNQLPAVGTQKPLPDTDGWIWRLLANEGQLSGPAPLRTVRVESADRKSQQGSRFWPRWLSSFRGPRSPQNRLEHRGRKSHFLDEKNMSLSPAQLESATSTARHARRSRRGLTMVEVLAATLLAALLMSAVLGVLKAVTSHQKEFTRGLPDSWRSRFCSLLEWDLQNSKTVLLNPDGFELRGLAGRDLASGIPLHCRTSIEYAVKKVRDESCLIRTEIHLEAPNLDSVRRELVLSQIERIDLGINPSSAGKAIPGKDSAEGDPLPDQATVCLIGSDSHAEVFRHVFPIR